MRVEDTISRYGQNIARVQSGPGGIRPVADGGNGGYAIYSDRNRQHTRRQYMMGLNNG